eukprot:67657_1
MGTCCNRSAPHDIGSNENKHSDQTITQKADSMQMVLPNIYMGSAVAAKNRDLLIQNAVTHIIAIGWNLETHFEDAFKYLLINRIEDSPECLILNQFEKCFEFMDECFNNKNGKLFVHCHKGLSRSATVVIAYEMLSTKTDFDSVLCRIRENRPFIMPNIGFQAQLHEFYNQHYTLDMCAYIHFDVINFIQQRLPQMLSRVKYNYNAYQSNPDGVNCTELFELTLYCHQVYKLKQKDKLNANDIKILSESIKILRDIQVEFVQNESSIKRFDIMFRNSNVITSMVPKQKEDNDHNESTHLIATNKKKANK